MMLKTKTKEIKEPFRKPKVQREAHLNQIKNNKPENKNLKEIN